MKYHPGSEMKRWDFEKSTGKIGLKKIPFKFDMEV
jgi:hypothetical protein